MWVTSDFMLQNNTIPDFALNNSIAGIQFWLLIFMLLGATGAIAW